ncbi:hypothetical protein QBC45DRAFT_400631 [Copromyces sp. CBS 386.78]|nr:hypothetical protein QBC45DRAFT_400631 [Copromyces sp. CBS 386.78]
MRLAVVSSYLFLGIILLTTSCFNSAVLSLFFGYCSFASTDTAYLEAASCRLISSFSSLASSFHLAHVCQLPSLPFLSLLNC